MTDKFTEKYLQKVRLCREILHYICYTEELKDLKPDQVRKLMLVLFSEDVINKATNMLFELDK